MSPPPVSIIDSAGANVLSLFEVKVNISLLTNGGQSVTNYIVSWCSWQVCAWAEVCKMVVGCVLGVLGLRYYVL